MSELLATSAGHIMVLLAILVMLGLLIVAAAIMVTAMLRRSSAQRRAALVVRNQALSSGLNLSADLAVAAERTRIAREMHDIVAHSLSVVIAQADGGRYAAGADQEAAGRALATIAETGRAALADMRRILGVLRTPDAPVSDPADLRAPVPDDHNLAELVEQVRATGLDISMVQLGKARTLPMGMGLAIYRVAQEALTNILKHAGPGVHVTIIDRWTDSCVTLDISDDGRGAAAVSTTPSGHGLVGMRERVELFGGTISAGPNPGGGFRVAVVMPLPRSTDSTWPRTDAITSLESETQGPLGQLQHRPEKMQELTALSTVS